MNTTSKFGLRCLKIGLQIATEVPITDRKIFAICFRETQQYLDLSDLELAKIFEISRPTVGRWARGESAPHPIGRTPILKALLKRVEKELEK